MTAKEDVALRSLAGKRRRQCTEGDEKESNSQSVCKAEPIRFAEKMNV